MQTFLPRPSFAQSASVLDNGRLNKQITEAMQILHAIHDETSAWHNHPCVKMWSDYHEALIAYGGAMYAEWQARFDSGKRGGKRTHKAGEYFLSLTQRMNPDLPLWLGDETFHASHRSNLLRKDPAWYSQFNWNEPNDLPYIWPRLEEYENEHGE
jgi:hypothetical protein